MSETRDTAGAAEPTPEPKSVEKKIELKEFKEIKFEKNEKIEKPEFKELKDHKHEKLEKNENKEHKDAKNEKLEKNEIKEHKDAKHEKLEKNEIKEHKDAKHEKIEKPENKEISKLENPEKPIGKEKDGKELVEGPQGPGGPVEQRLALLEQHVANLQHFITSGQRPDLSRGALSAEPDTGTAASSSASARERGGRHST
jgi:hypothetical protein